MSTQVNVALLAGALVFLVAAVGARLSARVGLPSLLAYLALGLAVGEAGLGVRFDDFAFTQTAGLLALALILAEGGLTTRWDVIRPCFVYALMLATLGVAVSVVVVASLAWLVLDVSVRTAALLGAVVSSTDVAAVFSVLRRLPVPLKPRLNASLEAESGLNDPPVIILVTIISSSAWNEGTLTGALLQVLYQLAIGAAVGLAVGWVGRQLLHRVALPAAGLYPLATLAVAMASYGAANVAGASGFVAIYLTALLLGNAATLPHRRATLGFADGVAWLAQIGLFVMLGLLASPARLPSAVPTAVIVGGALMLLARPLSVALISPWFRVPWREQAFLSWAGLRGAVPIVVATVPFTAGLPGSTRLFDTVFLLVVIFTLIQGPTLPPLARALGVTEAIAPRELQVETAPLEDLHADLLQTTVPERSLLVGVYLTDLRLPKGATVTLIVRGRTAHPPDDYTVLRPGDKMLIVAPTEVRNATERRLRAVSRAGRLARWYGETGEPSPESKVAQRARQVAQRVRHR